MWIECIKENKNDLMLSWDFLHCLLFVKSQFLFQPVKRLNHYSKPFPIWLNFPYFCSPPSLPNIQNKIYYRKKCSNINIFSLVPLLDFWWFLTFSLEISHTKGSNISLEWLSTFHFIHLTSWYKNWWKMSKGSTKKLGWRKSKNSKLANFTIKTSFKRLEIKKLWSKLEL